MQMMREHARERFWNRDRFNPKGNPHIGRVRTIALVVAHPDA
jgi:hypothetical protein